MVPQFAFGALNPAFPSKIIFKCPTTFTTGIITIFVVSFRLLATNFYTSSFSWLVLFFLHFSQEIQRSYTPCGGDSPWTLGTVFLGCQKFSYHLNHWRYGRDWSSIEGTSGLWLIVWSSRCRSRAIRPTVHQTIRVDSRWIQRPDSTSSKST